MYLETRGPIGCAGYWTGSGHIIALTGVDGGAGNLNDPDGGVKKTGSSTAGWSERQDA